jgi:hypothetical protein
MDGLSFSSDGGVDFTIGERGLWHDHKHMFFGFTDTPGKYVIASDYLGASNIELVSYTYANGKEHSLIDIYTDLAEGGYDTNDGDRSIYPNIKLGDGATFYGSVYADTKNISEKNFSY